MVASLKIAIRDSLIMLSLKLKFSYYVFWVIDKNAGLIHFPSRRLSLQQALELSVKTDDVSLRIFIFSWISSSQRVYKSTWQIKKG